MVTRDGGCKAPTLCTHRQLASTIGANREAITRAFGGLQDERVEQLRKRRIHVPDMETLKRLWVDEDRD